LLLLPPSSFLLAEPEYPIVLYHEHEDEKGEHGKKIFFQVSFLPLPPSSSSLPLLSPPSSSLNPSRGAEYPIVLYHEHEDEKGEHGKKNFFQVSFSASNYYKDINFFHHFTINPQVRRREEEGGRGGGGRRGEEVGGGRREVREHEDEKGEHGKKISSAEGGEAN
jgi:hypothetical protein